MTTAEWMELRFGTRKDGHLARLFAALSNLIVAISFLCYFVKGTGKFLAIFLPFSPEICSIIMVLIGLFYTCMSGFYGVIYTDVIQELLMISAAVFIGIKAATLPEHAAVIGYAGEQWIDFIPVWMAKPMNWLADPEIYHFFGLCIVFWIGKGLLEGAGGLTGGYMPQRYYAVKSDRDASLMSAEWILLLLFRWALIVGTAFLGLWLAMHHDAVAQVLNSDPEKTLPLVVANAIPSGFRGLVVAGLVAAAMSTFDSTVNAGASYWIRDIYQRYLRPEAEKSTLMRQSILATIVLSLIGVVLGLLIHNIDEIWGWITGPLSAGLFAPIILRWYWWRFNGYGFAASTAVGLGSAILIKLATPHLVLYLSFPLIWGLSLLSGIVFSLLTPAVSSEVSEAFWLKVRPFGIWKKITRQLPNEMVRQAHREHFRDILIACIAIGWHLCGVVMVITLIIHSWHLCIAAVALFVVLGLVLYFFWYRNLQSKKDARIEAERDTQALINSI